MASALVDTDVVSFLFKGDTRAADYDVFLAGRILVISFMSLAELDLWAQERRWGTSRIASMARHLRRFVVHPYDRALCRTWADVMHTTRRKGRPMQTADAWIAASALLLDVPLVTNNPVDYANVDQLVVLSAASMGE